MAEVTIDPATIDAAEKAVLDMIPATYYAGDARVLKRAAAAIRKLAPKPADTE